MDVAFANVFKISCRAGEKNGIWVKYFWGRIHFQDTSFRLKITFSDRTRNIKLIWKFEYLPLLRKGHDIDLGGYTQPFSKDVRARIFCIYSIIYKASVTDSRSTNKKTNIFANCSCSGIIASIKSSQLRWYLKVEDITPEREKLKKKFLRGITGQSAFCQFHSKDLKGYYSSRYILENCEFLKM